MNFQLNDKNLKRTSLMHRLLLAGLLLLSSNINALSIDLPSLYALNNDSRNQYVPSTTAPGYGPAVSTIMHITTNDASNPNTDPTTYVPTCFPSTANYKEELLDFKVFGSYARPSSGTIIYRCMRIGTPGTVPNYPSSVQNGVTVYWTPNPYKSYEMVTTSLTTYSQYVATIPSTSFDLNCNLDTPQGQYIYRYIGFKLQYYDLNGNTQTLTQNVDLGSNCGGAGAALIQPQKIPPGWVGIQPQNFTGNGGTNIDCSSTGYISYYLAPNQLGTNCYFTLRSPQSSATCGNHCGYNNCTITMNCSGTAHTVP